MFNIPFLSLVQLVLIQINSNSSLALVQPNSSILPLFIFILVMVNIGLIVFTGVTIVLRYTLAKYLNQLVNSIETIINKISNLSEDLSQKRKRSLNQQGLDKQLEKEIQQCIDENKNNKLLRKSIIFKTLEKRFREASENLEQVNTAALIDRLYSQEKCRFLGFYFRCEQIDYWCRILPNLLLAVGVLGTCGGIIINLSELKDIVNQDFRGNIKAFQDAFKPPLFGMAIAFTISFTAIGCSIILSLVNFFCNTSLAKSHLISSLEDYLDNIIQPTILGHTRLDTAVNRMVEKQNEFLTRFHENVTQAVESSLGNVAKQIAEGNKEATELARQVYQRFTETAGTLDTGANTFKYAVQDTVLSIQEQIKALNKITPELELFSKSFASGSRVFLKAAQQIEQSKFSENLEKLTLNLATTQERFSQSTALLEQHIGQIVEGNHRTTELAQQVYSKWQDSSGKLEESAIVFLEASEKIQQSQFADKLSTATVDLDNIFSQFSQSASHLNQSTETVHSALTSLQKFVEEMSILSQQLSGLNQQSAEIIDVNRQQLTIEEDSFRMMQSEINQLVESVRNYEQQIGDKLKGLSSQLVRGLEQNLGSHTQQIQAITNQLEQQVNYLAQTQSEISQLTEAVKQSEQQNLIGLQKLSDRLVQSSYQQIEINTKELQNFTEQIGRSGQHLNEIKSDLASFLEKLIEQLAELQKAIKEINRPRNFFNRSKSNE